MTVAFDGTAVVDNGASLDDTVVPDNQGRLEAEEAGRLLFRHLAGEEWREYRAIMAVFAGTFFSEFTPEEVAERLAERGTPLDPAVVGERLESLRRWGNLTASSATGSPASLSDYYRRRNRYLITRAGQEVHEAVEGVLARVDEVRDIWTGRLRSLLDALRALASTDVTSADPQQLADLVGAVFDPHRAFTTEITQFFAAINQWQNRYDLSAEEFSFFAQVLVNYVSERLDEIERASRPIAAALDALAASVPTIVERANRGLAARVEEAGLQSTVAVTRTAGSSVEDWEHLAGWFVGQANRPARLDRLRLDAVSAIRSLTLNLIRLSRVGLGGSSRRADFLRLASLLQSASAEEAATLANAAFGLYPAHHYGAVADDTGEPVPTATSWWEAPPARVPISLRERGETASRGRPSPIADRSGAQRLVQRRRELELAAIRQVDAELAAAGSVDGCTLSMAALNRLEELVGRALARMPVRAGRVELADGGVHCQVERAPGKATAVFSPEGILTLRGLRITVRSVAAP